MDQNSFRDALKTVKLTVLQAGRFFNVSANTARKWAKEGPSQPVALFLDYMIATGVDATDVMDALGIDPAGIYTTIE